MLLRKPIVIAVATFIVTVVLYALATGPILYFRSIGRPLMSVETFLIVYYPMNRLEGKIPPLKRAMDYYVSLWEQPAAERHAQTDTN